LGNCSLAIVFANLKSFEDKLNKYRKECLKEQIEFNAQRAHNFHFRINFTEDLDAEILFV
jgi:hypothetical protein